MKLKRLAILGAGPIGIEAALAASARGYDVRVYERGEVGQNLRHWGFVKMFSPFAMNASPLGISRIEDAPQPDALLTGREYVTQYLSPLANTLGDSLRTRTEVIAVGRDGLLKHEKIGDPARAERPFRLILRSANGEVAELADLIFDCTGNYSTPNFLGIGGIQAPGEKSCSEDLIRYGIADAAGLERGQFTKKNVLVVGGGHSAATVVRDLVSADATVSWATRKKSPVRRIENDPLDARDSLLAEAEALVESGRVQHFPQRSVLSLERRGNSVAVTFANGEARAENEGEKSSEVEPIVFDRIIAATGFRPDLSLTRELQTQICWATEGSYKLAASLLGEEGGGGDCLQISGFGAETLTHPEPHFFTLGIKSYGRTPDFLIQTGLKHIETLLDYLESSPLTK